MNVSRYRLNAQNALISLEGAAMGVMYEAKGPLKPGDISGYLGIPAYERGRANAYLIVAEILDRLERKGLVRHAGERGPWMLTQKGLEGFEQSRT